ncbi:PhzF family phenazine biosynthesis protein [Pandoraea sp. NE5]|uniref:PhzF family phenazine biosynthesis protein n=1 Tax=Pandoraea sp. NE5 TaxID=2904129 RepID=UPI0021C35C23|nr:PhzF family phenazine biosynthesis protein [Pandoraea sp. NE5]
MTEDPASGSATTATAALIAHVRGVLELALCVAQGVDMGRPSILRARIDLHDGPTRIRVGGKWFSDTEGSFQLEGDD